MGKADAGLCLFGSPPRSSAPRPRPQRSGTTRGVLGWAHWVNERMAARASAIRKGTASVPHRPRRCQGRRRRGAATRSAHRDRTRAGTPDKAQGTTNRSEYMAATPSVSTVQLPMPCPAPRAAFLPRGTATDCSLADAAVRSQFDFATATGQACLLHALSRALPHAFNVQS